MKEKIRISVVSYLNSRPFVYGLKKLADKESMDISYDIPAVCAHKLISGEADIGLVPVAVIPLIQNAEIISDFCIAAEGKVESVLLLSNIPLQEIKRVILDKESRTSVRLARVLARELWKISPEWVEESTSSQLTAGQGEGVVVIGDRAIAMRHSFQYIYDLAEEWQKLTSLPFVFACWVSNRKIDKSFAEHFNAALDYGISHVNDYISETKLDDYSARYLREVIKYRLDDEKRKAIKLFLEKEI